MDGSIQWQKTFPGAAGPVTPLYATSDGGAVVTSTIPACPGGNIVTDAALPTQLACQGTDDRDIISLPYSPQGYLGTLYTLDQYGNVTAQTADIGRNYSWTNNWYADPAGTISRYSFPVLNITPSFWPFIGANESGNRVALLRETLYLRSFAPWPLFGPDPVHLCFTDCFKGDNRSFSTSTDSSVTSRINGIVDFGLPGMVVISKRAYSDPSFDIAGRTATGKPTITASSNGNGGLHVEVAGPNPLVFGAPDIDTKLDVRGQFGAAQTCYSGHLYGNAFPNSEAFVINSQKEAKSLITFATTEGRNLGPFTLYGNKNRDMGVFAVACIGN
jgi:hypothetical protein